jgi:LPS-assembly protein
MAHRGFKHGLEYRYVLSTLSKGTLMYDFLYDEQIDDGTTPSDSSGYRYEGFRGDSENRLNRKRWWFRMKNDWGLPAGFNAKLDVDVVSDQDYLREFDTIYSGYDNSDQYFLDEFGRGLDDKTDTVRLNQLNISRSWNQFSLNTDFRWYDNVIVRKHNRDDSTLQKLPTVSFSASKQEIPSFPFYFDLTSSLNNFWRDVGTHGYSAELYPRVYYPTTIFEYFDLEPSVGLRETVWQVERYEPASPNEEDQLRSRELGDFQADLSTEISRVFDLEDSSIDKIRHAIKPQVVYTYVPDVEQDDLPDFVSSIGETNQLTYSVTNSFTSRNVEKANAGSETTSDAEQEQSLAPPKYSYRDFCRITLSQSYDILKARRLPPAGSERRPFSNVSGRLELNPMEFLDFVGNASWCQYDGEYKSYDTTLAIKNERGDHASVDYRYSQNSSESILTKVFVKVFDPLSAYWELEHNLKDKKDIKSVLGFAYEPQCWSFFLRYTDDRTTNKREYFFEISLYGLGRYKLGKYKPGEGK